MSNQQPDQPTDLPKIGAPATNALNGAGYYRLEQLTQVTEAELMALHGFGPKALRILKEALAERGLALKG
ncbi:MAG: DNA-binding protein [Chloroflexi bacterium]|uniref:DNA-directed RNA polymerase subunit alpha C-terminal domain-containing protein n=1 Tax=Candidatus Flexifilum breve TaxID=3140694 RepID=UPI003135C62E|nr:DNA-binding protein [Chloroflexota bacterium]